MLAAMGGPGSGGARSYSGPPPDPNALKRQRDGKEWTKLPAAGRIAPAPEWPLAIPEPNENETLLWRDLWTMPQALIWEQDRSHQLVAFYVRTYLEAMHPKAGAQARMFVRQLSNDLYLAPAALMSGRYVVDGTDEALAIDAATATHEPTKRRTAKPKSARDRFKVVGNTGPADDDEEPQPETDVATGEVTAIDDDEPPF
jgi:hypothetical protein